MSVFLQLLLIARLSVTVVLVLFLCRGISRIDLLSVYFCSFSRSIVMSWFIISTLVLLLPNSNFRYSFMILLRSKWAYRRFSILDATAISSPLLVSKTDTVLSRIEERHSSTVKGKYSIAFCRLLSALMSSPGFLSSICSMAILKYFLILELAWNSVGWSKASWNILLSNLILSFQFFLRV
jgi:hypothetical protein